MRHIPFLALLASMPVWAEKPHSTDSISAQYDLDAVVVTGARTHSAASVLPLTVTVIDADAVADRHESSLLGTLTEQVPGFFSTSRGVLGYGISTGSAGGINVRGVGGSNTAEVLVLIDGHPQYAGLMGHPLSDNLLSLGVGKVEVVRGPASVLYGSNAMGGVINIVTENALSEEGAHGKASVMAGSYGTVESSLSGRLRVGRVTESMGLLYNRTDGHRANSAFNQTQGSIGLGYELNRYWNFHADAQISRIMSENPGKVTSPLEECNADIRRGVMSVGLKNDFGGMNGDASFFMNTGNHVINDGHLHSAEQLDYRFHSRDALMGANIYESFSLFEGNRTTVGFDWMHNTGWAAFEWRDSTVSAPWDKTLPEVDRWSDELAGYVDFNQELGKFHLGAGIRYDWHSIFGSMLVPQAGLTYRVADGQLLKASFGKGFRNPTFRDAYMFSSRNPDLKPEETLNYELSWNGVWGNFLRLGLNLFYIEGKNIIQTVMNGNRWQNMNIASIHNSGVEVTAAVRLSPDLTFSGNYSFLHMKEPVICAPQRKLYVEGEWQHGSFAGICGLQYISGLYTVLETATSPAVTQEYVLLNSRISYTFSPMFSVFLRGENLMNRSYETYDGYTMPGITVFGGIVLSL